MTQDVLARGASRGIEPGYRRNDGQWQAADPEAVEAVLAALGDEAAPTGSGLPPCVVAWDGAAAPIRLSSGAAKDAVLVLADGSWSPVTVAHDEVQLPAPLPLGRHTLHVDSDTCLVLSAPARGGSLAGKRRFGVFAPLPWLRAGARDRGAGHVGCLSRVAADLHELGGTVVATLPLLARAPEQASPYSPLTRCFWDERLLDLDAVCSRWGLEPPAAARRAELVDPASDAAAVRSVLDWLAARERPRELDDWVQRRPGAVAYARFRAAAERRGADWHRWPAAWRANGIPPAAVPNRIVEAHLWAQFLAATQIEELSAALTARGQLLYLDLPLGTDPLGFDRWRHGSLVLEGVSLGAPPDGFHESGQDWSLSPVHPERSRAAGHPVWREAVEHHLSAAAMLRIDHAMGLHRQFWIPAGFPPGRGVYVRQPADELWATLLLAAHERGALLVAENLGTVPRDLEDALSEHGVAGSFVAQWELGQGTALRRPVPAGAAASLNTHDLPTFASFWRDRHGEESDAGEARDALLETLGRSSASLVLVDLADLELAAEPHNVPGATDPANWCRRSARATPELLTERGVRSALERLAAARRWVPPQAPRTEHGVFVTDLDLHLIGEGSHFDLASRLGSHRTIRDGVEGTAFAVWAPAAAGVAVRGDWDGWRTPHELAAIASSGVWDGFVPGAEVGHRYKLEVRTADGRLLEKADPCAQFAELPPGNASIVTESRFAWNDASWLRERPERQRPGDPLAIYEVHLGSWRRVPEEGDRPLSYRELGPALASYCSDHGFTHVELMPVMEHPFTGSWGYQVTGFFAPTSRYGTPDDFRFLVDCLHRHGIGVILDWVPAHFPDDAHGLAGFDGTALYEHADPREGRHPDWGSLIFNYGRHEVQSFLISSATYWLDEFHIDGLRVDAVASMLYRDYSRAPGEWVPNRFGGRENLEAVRFLRRACDEIRRRHPDALLVAEESTSWPGVTAPTDHGGLGFSHKWDMGWMHDTLTHLARDPVHRRWHHRELTFRGLYLETEQWILPLSHDEVVHGKGSLLGRMAGDRWQRFANLRVLFGLQYGMQGGKLVFMGGEFGQEREWSHDRSLDWHLLELPEHAGITSWVTALNDVLRTHPSLRDEPGGFRWISADDAEQNVLAWSRHAPIGPEATVWVANLTPAPRAGYRVGLPGPGTWTPLVNGDEPAYGGSGNEIVQQVEAVAEPWHGQQWSATLTLPPLAVIALAGRT